MPAYNKPVRKNAKNAKVLRPNTTNLAGGSAFKQDKFVELVSILVTTFLQEKFYATNDMVLDRLTALFNETNPKDVAKALLFTRNVAGLRSVTHFGSAWLANYIKGENWTRNYFYNVFRRPDDMTETVACFQSLYGDSLPNSLKDGIRRAIGKFNAYQLAKYRESDKEVKLIDLVNLTHPRNTTENGFVDGVETLRLLMRGELKSPDTWEVGLSRGDKDTWNRLLSEGTLGYNAALQNIRNITQAYERGDVTKWNYNKLFELLRNETAIVKSLVMPHQIYNAFRVTYSDFECEKENIIRVRQALEDAALLSLYHVPMLGNKVVSALDVSGSMTGNHLNGHSKTTVSEIAGIFAVTVALRNNGVLLSFDGTARKISLKNTNILEQTYQIDYRGGGTNFASIFGWCLRNDYNPDTIFIASDMQAWASYDGLNTTGAYARFATHFGHKPIVFGMDLAGYGTTQFHDNVYYGLAGFGNYTMRLMDRLYNDKNALVNEVLSIDL